MVACGCLWLPVAACGCLWLPVAACDCLWLPVAWASSKDNFETWQGSDNFVFENSPKLRGEMKYYF